MVKKMVKIKFSRRWWIFFANISRNTIHREKLLVTILVENLTQRVIKGKFIKTSSPDPGKKYLYFTFYLETGLPDLPTLHKPPFLTKEINFSLQMQIHQKF